MPIIEIKVEGLKKITTGFIRFIPAVRKNLAPAGLASLALILDTVGLRTYPPTTDANRPPTPYYQRGLGTVYKNSVARTSENYGKQWTTEAESFLAKAKNTASYAEFLGGEKQVSWAPGYGWKKLFSTAKELIPEIVEIYTEAVEKTIKELGL